MPVERHLAAVLAVDMVGYTKLMTQNEDDTLSTLSRVRADVLYPEIAEHRGRVFKTTGDGVLAEFTSVVNATACAISIQQKLHDRDDARTKFRIGISLGDVVVEGDDVFGEAVNLASRIESLAPPGGIAVSSTVRDHLGSRLNVDFEDVGAKHLKNVDGPVLVYLVTKASNSKSSFPTFAVSAGPSIAVLPFLSMSSDPALDYFADGITEDLITALSRIDELFVVSRHSSFVYKGRSMSIQTVARELGVRYLLEGTVRASGKKVRVTAQLIDGVNGNHVWAERYDDNLEDVFELQDSLVRDITVALQVKLTLGDLARLWEGQTKSLRAWEKMVQGRNHFHKWSRADINASIRVLEEAVAIDPDYTGAIVQLGLTLWWAARSVPDVDKETLLDRAEAYSERALKIDPRMGAAYALKGGVAFLRDFHDESVSLGRIAVRLSPSDAWSLAFCGVLCIFAGRAEEGAGLLASAIRISPHAPAWYTYNLALAHLWMGSIANAQTDAERYLQMAPDDPYAHMLLAIIYGVAGKEVEAVARISRLKELDPSFSLLNVRLSQRYRDKQQLATVIDILGRCGLPNEDHGRTPNAVEGTTQACHHIATDR